jgi:hypothetical protein
VTIILGGDSPNKTFFLKEQDGRYLFFPCIIFRAAAMSGATEWRLHWGTNFRPSEIFVGRKKKANIHNVEGEGKGRKHNFRPLMTIPPTSNVIFVERFFQRKKPNKYPKYPVPPKEHISPTQKLPCKPRRTAPTSHTS